MPHTHLFLKNTSKQNKIFTMTKQNPPRAPRDSLHFTPATPLASRWVLEVSGPPLNISERSLHLVDNKIWRYIKTVQNISKQFNIHQTIYICNYMYIYIYICVCVKAHALMPRHRWWAHRGTWFWMKLTRCWRRISTSRSRARPRNVNTRADRQNWTIIGPMTWQRHQHGETRTTPHILTRLRKDTGTIYEESMRRWYETWPWCVTRECHIMWTCQTMPL